MLSYYHSGDTRPAFQNCRQTSPLFCRETLFLSSKMFTILTSLKRQPGKNRTVNALLQKHLDNYRLPVERALGANFARV